ncbi:DUF58 domain-containing protein [Virgibacillus xinjiangensis]|uniref:DUF58 domain-containing protein n=1 Tax=Virgibacillus xinjiangensis TaxID=393090 RepID=A0ABV7CSM0_9BACI
MNSIIRLMGNLLFIFLLFAALFSYAMFQGGFTSWFLFFGFLPIFLYQVALLFYPLRHWKVKRHLQREAVKAGGNVSVTITVERGLPFPLFYCVFEEVFSEGLHRKDDGKRKYRHMDRPGHYNMDREVKRAVFPSFRRRIEVSYQLEALPRGVHQLEGVTIRCGDLFGLARKEVFIPLEDQLLVYPAQDDVRLTGSWSSLDEGGKASSWTWHHTNIAVGAREYAPGDKISSIDWKQTARKNEVMTKEFEQEEGMDVLLVLDSCWHQGMNPLAFEATVELAASLVRAMRRQSIRTRLLIVGGESVYIPGHGEEQMAVAQRQLARIQPSRSGPFVLKLREEIFRVKEGNVVLLITSHVDRAWLEAIQPMKTRSKYMVVLFVQASTWISEEERDLLTQMEMEGMEVIPMTESELVQTPVEVRGK